VFESLPGRLSTLKSSSATGWYIDQQLSMHAGIAVLKRRLKTVTGSRSSACFWPASCLQPACSRLTPRPSHGVPLTANSVSLSPESGDQTGPATSEARPPTAQRSPRTDYGSIRPLCWRLSLIARAWLTTITPGSLADDTSEQIPAWWRCGPWFAVARLVGRHHRLCVRHALKACARSLRYTEWRQLAAIPKSRPSSAVALGRKAGMVMLEACVIL